MLPAAVPIALCALAAAFSAWLAWHDVERMAAAPRAAVAEAAPTTNAAPVAPATDGTASLPDLPLFGTAEQPDETVTPAPPAQVEPDESQLPASTAGYQLFGLIEAEQPAEARAILGGADGQQQEYRIGDSMPDGARVHAIRARAVLFERNGALEKLALPELELGGDPGAGSPVPPAALPGRIRPMIPGMNGMPSRLGMPGARPAPTPMPVPDAVPPPDVPPEISPDMPMEPEPVAQ
jgi:hypothetical protein